MVTTPTTSEPSATMAARCPRVLNACATSAGVASGGTMTGPRRIASATVSRDVKAGNSWTARLGTVDGPAARASAGVNTPARRSPSITTRQPLGSEASRIVAAVRLSRTSAIPLALRIIVLIRI